ncbi:hypothetical protein FOT89_24640, partial [Klebsiella aerogenes]|nr:hypothetical protein [Klebsiella aerogenes]
MGSQVRCNYAPGKVGRFPHDSSARQGGRISTRQRRPARWADSHTAAAPGKVGRFPHGTGARQGGPVTYPNLRAQGTPGQPVSTCPTEKKKTKYQHTKYNRR